MAATIVVAGATGSLGMRIVKALLGHNARVVALSRNGTAADKVKALETLGATVSMVDMGHTGNIAEACAGADCVISTLAGLRDVVVDAQSLLLEGAVLAGVPRFIPSDFSSDFTKLTPGENRNFDLRREFHALVEKASIKATSIYNSAFAEVLTYNIPLLDFKKRTVGYWEDPAWRIDFTTMDNTADFTALVALDANTPRALCIASFQVSANDLIAFTAKAFDAPFALVRLGSLEELRAYNQRERAAHPEGENELYASWQQSQYMQSMFSAHHEALDNSRYSGIAWSKLGDVISGRLRP